MKQKLFWSKLKTGSILTTALGLIFMAVFFAGNVQSLFVGKIDITLLIKDVRGLRSGAPIWYSGIEVGQVKAIRLDPRRGTVVTLRIKKKEAGFIPKDSSATIMTMGLLGDKYIEIKSGTKPASLEHGDTMEGKSQLETMDIVESASLSLGGVTDFTGKLATLVDHINKSEGTLAGLINDPVLFNELKKSAQMLSVILEQFQATNGSLRQMAASPSLYQNLDQSVRDLRSLLVDLEAGRGAAGVMLKDEATAKKLKHAIEGLDETVIELKGMVKDMKQNPKKYFKFSVF